MDSFCVSELEWLLYQLWNKKNPQWAGFSFDIADTILMRQGECKAWYYSNKEGQVMKRQEDCLSEEFIARDFMLKQNNPQLPVARSYIYKQQANFGSKNSGSIVNALSIGYLTGQNLVDYLGSSGIDIALQAFIVPTHQENRNNVLMIELNFEQIKMQRIVNKYNLFDSSLPISKRCITADDTTMKDSEKQTLPSTGVFFNQCDQALREIRMHMRKNSNLTVTHGKFYFKYDHFRQKLIFLNATQLKMDKPLQGVISAQFMISMHQEEVNRIKKSETQVRLESTESQGMLYNQPEETDQRGLQSQKTLVKRKSMMRIKKMNNTKQIKVDLSSNDQEKESVEQHALIKNRLAYLNTLTWQKNACPLCKEKLNTYDNNGTSRATYPITANQIINLHEYFESNPDSLLTIARNTSKFQHKFYEEIHAQFTSVQADNDENKIPILLQKAINLHQNVDYLKLKDDPSFLFKEFNICELCFGSLKKMIAHQSKDKIKAKRLPLFKINQSQHRNTTPRIESKQQLRSSLQTTEQSLTMRHQQNPYENFAGASEIQSTINQNQIATNLDILTDIKLAKSLSLQQFRKLLSNKRESKIELHRQGTEAVYQGVFYQQRDQGAEVHVSSARPPSGKQVGSTTAASPIGQNRLRKLVSKTDRKQVEKEFNLWMVQQPLASNLNDQQKLSRPQSGIILNAERSPLTSFNGAQNPYEYYQNNIGSKQFVTITKIRPASAKLEINRKQNRFSCLQSQDSNRQSLDVGRFSVEGPGQQNLKFKKKDIRVLKTKLSSRISRDGCLQLHPKIIQSSAATPKSSQKQIARVYRNNNQSIDTVSKSQEKQQQLLEGYLEVSKSHKLLPLHNTFSGKVRRPDSAAIFNQNRLILPSGQQSSQAAKSYRKMQKGLPSNTDYKNYKTHMQPQNLKVIEELNKKMKVKQEQLEDHQFKISISNSPFVLKQNNQNSKLNHQYLQAAQLSSSQQDAKMAIDSVHEIFDQPDTIADEHLEDLQKNAQNLIQIVQKIKNDRQAKLSQLGRDSEVPFIQRNNFSSIENFVNVIATPKRKSKKKDHNLVMKKLKKQLDLVMNDQCEREEQKQLLSQAEQMPPIILIEQENIKIGYENSKTQKNFAEESFNDRAVQESMILERSSIHTDPQFVDDQIGQNFQELSEDQRTTQRSIVQKNSMVQESKDDATKMQIVIVDSETPRVNMAQQMAIDNNIVQRNNDVTPRVMDTIPGVLEVQKNMTVCVEVNNNEITPRAEAAQQVAIDNKVVNSNMKSTPRVMMEVLEKTTFFELANNETTPRAMASQQMAVDNDTLISNSDITPRVTEVQQNMMVQQNMTVGVDVNNNEITPRAEAAQQVAIDNSIANSNMKSTPRAMMKVLEKTTVNGELANNETTPRVEATQQMAVDSDILISKNEDTPRVTEVQQNMMVQQKMTLGVNEITPRVTVVLQNMTVNGEPEKNEQTPRVEAAQQMAIDNDNLISNNDVTPRITEVEQNMMFQQNMTLEDNGANEITPRVMEVLQNMTLNGESEKNETTPRVAEVQQRMTVDIELGTNEQTPRMLSKQQTINGNASDIEPSSQDTQRVFAAEMIPTTDQDASHREKEQTEEQKTERAENPTTSEPTAVRVIELEEDVDEASFIINGMPEGNDADYAVEEKKDQINITQVTIHQKPEQEAETSHEQQEATVCEEITAKLGIISSRSETQTVVKETTEEIVTQRELEQQSQQILDENYIDTATEITLSQVEQSVNIVKDKKAVQKNILGISPNAINSDQFKSAMKSVVASAQKLKAQDRNNLDSQGQSNSTKKVEKVVVESQYVSNSSRQEEKTKQTVLQIDQQKIEKQLQAVTTERSQAPQTFQLEKSFDNDRNQQDKQQPLRKALTQVDNKKQMITLLLKIEADNAPAFSNDHDHDLSNIVISANSYGDQRSTELIQVTNQLYEVCKNQMIHLEKQPSPRIDDIKPVIESAYMIQRNSKQLSGSNSARVPLAAKRISETPSFGPPPRTTKAQIISSHPHRVHQYSFQDDQSEQDAYDGNQIFSQQQEKQDSQIFKQKALNQVPESKEETKKPYEEAKIEQGAQEEEQDSDDNSISNQLGENLNLSAATENNEAWV